MVTMIWRYQYFRAPMNRIREKKNEFKNSTVKTLASKMKVSKEMPSRKGAWSRFSQSS
jgi:hypothetical protein